jgi:hypothetical protein
MAPESASTPSAPLKEPVYRQRIVEGRDEPMTQTEHHPSLEESRKIAYNMLSSFLSASAIDAVLATQIQVLKISETMMSSWVHYRQEAMNEMQQVLVRAREPTDLDELANLPQEWMANCFRWAIDDIRCGRIALSAVVADQSAAPDEIMARSKLVTTLRNAA